MSNKHLDRTASRQAAQEPFIRLMRELALTFHAFTALDARLMRHYDLTLPQADVIFTLGNTDGMTLGELGERTLITKGTLTGVVDRLVAKELVCRSPAAHDGRCTVATLTREGDELFQRVFPVHIAAHKQHFGRLSPETREHAIELLREIRAVL